LAGKVSTVRQEGLIQVYTGDGKGKTTAAIGQAVRAVGHDFKVGLVYFFKNPQDFEYGELKALNKLGIKSFHFAPRHPHHYKVGFEEVRQECLKGVEFVKRLFADKSWDLLILDELNIALRDGFLKEEEVLELLEAKPPNLELILTGRGATERVINKADLVSEIKNVRHPFKRLVTRRKGIEY